MAGTDEKHLVILVEQKLLSGSATTKERSLSLSVLQWPILDPGCHSG